LDIKHKHNDKKGLLYIEKNEVVSAEMTYSKAGKSLIVIDHTEVNELFKGIGLGLILVEAAVNYARINEIKIMPLCPFAKAMFKKHPEFKDVLK
jgi:predicted GNAT family acetyltransferase